MRLVAVCLPTALSHFVCRQIGLQCNEKELVGTVQVFSHAISDTVYSCDVMDANFFVRCSHIFLQCRTAPYRDHKVFATAHTAPYCN